MQFVIIQTVEKVTRIAGIFSTQAEAVARFDELARAESRELLAESGQTPTDNPDVTFEMGNYYKDDTSIELHWVSRCE